MFGLKMDTVCFPIIIFKDVYGKSQKLLFFMVPQMHVERKKLSRSIIFHLKATCLVLYKKALKCSSKFIPYL